ncbi:MAG: metal ABC transporter substrate-binding protein [Chloroflexota bacterium]
MKTCSFLFAIASLLAFSVILFGCTAPVATPAVESGSRLNVLATTTIVADVVRNIGGEKINLTVLLPTGVDPHSFQPAPQDIAKMADADLIFANGAGLEEFLTPMIESANAREKVIYVSEGIELLESAESDDLSHEAEVPSSTHTAEEPEHHHEGGDPHVWFDPNNVIIWTHNITQALSKMDPANAESYQKNSENYLTELKALDEWIRQQVSSIPAENRKLVTDHLVFTYFAERYGFVQEGAVIPGYSTVAEPSAQEIAALEDIIRQQGVKAIFVGNSVNPALSRRVAEDTGVQLITIFTGSLSAPGGGADTYLEFMRYNVNAIVQALSSAK